MRIFVLRVFFAFSFFAYESLFLVCVVFVVSVSVFSVVL